MEPFERIEPEDVLCALSRLEFDPPGDAISVKGPRAERSVSGRGAAARGPFLLSDLDLMLDRELVDQLLLADAPAARTAVEAVVRRAPEPIPVEAPSFLSEPPIRERGSILVRAPALLEPVGLDETITRGPRPPFMTPRRPASGGGGVPLDRSSCLTTADRAQESPVAPGRRVGSPALRGLASLLVPGWGQARNGEPRKAVLFRVFALMTLIALDVLILRGPIVRFLEPTPIVLPAGFWDAILISAIAGWLVWILSAYDALIVASLLTPREPAR